LSTRWRNRHRGPGSFRPSLDRRISGGLCGLRFSDTFSLPTSFRTWVPSCRASGQRGSWCRRRHDIRGLDANRLHLAVFERNRRQQVELSRKEPDMTNALTSDVRRGTTWSIAISVLMIVTGVLAIGLPMTAGIAVTAVVGWMLICSAIL